MLPILFMRNAKAKRDEVPGHILKQLLEVIRNG